MSVNTSKYKATTVLTREDFPPLSRLSTEPFNPKFLSITPPYENTLFFKIVRQTQDSPCNNIISITKTLPQAITTCYMKSKLKAENLAVIKTCPTTAPQRDITKKKKTPIKKSQILSNIISNNKCNNLHHFDNNIIVQVDNWNTKRNWHETSVEVKPFKQNEKESHLFQNFSTVHHVLIFLGPV